MGRHPKLENLDKLFEKNERFSLSDAEYETKTGTRLPKNSNYLLNDSALARKCSDMGFSMRVQEKVVFFERIENK